MQYTHNAAWGADRNLEMNREEEWKVTERE